MESIQDDAPLMNDSANPVFDTRALPTWLGLAGISLVLLAMMTQAASVLISGIEPAAHTQFQSELQQGLRIALLLVSIGALTRLAPPGSSQWQWAVRLALTVLAIGVAAELFATTGGTATLDRHLGVSNGLEYRLFRLGAMATFAVPMLTLLAASEPKPAAARSDGSAWGRIGAFLVRWEGTLFAVGVSTLPLILLAGAFVNRELTWLSPIGADTTFAACVAASIRARSRRDRLACSGWLAVSISMGIGLLMGVYSFGGPLPAPTMIGDYDDIIRVLLRSGHVVLMSIGFVAIGLAGIRGQRV